MTKERTYRCPVCGQVAIRQETDFEANILTKRTLPAFLICGKCYSAHPDKPAPKMWGDDVTDRDPDHYTPFGAPWERRGPVFKDVEDISFSGRKYGKCVRFLVHRVFHGKASDDDLIRMAEMKVKALTRKQKVNAIAVRFHRSQSAAVKGISVAEVEWAPGGVWGDADTVRAGDYSRHKYVVTFNDT